MMNEPKPPERLRKLCDTFEKRLADHQTNAEPTYSESSIIIYNAFKEHILDARSVLYPGCYIDASPVRVFQSVTFVDINEHAINVLKQHGLNAQQVDIRDYEPTEEHDLLILLNPAMKTEWAAQHIPSGAHILSNDYHGNATQMARHPETYELQGTINFIDPKNPTAGVNISSNISDLFIPVQDEEELRRLRPQHHAFIIKAYPHLIKNSGQTPEEDFEAMYRQYARILQTSETFPARRVADQYIFVKK